MVETDRDPLVKAMEATWGGGAGVCMHASVRVLELPAGRYGRCVHVCMCEGVIGVQVGTGGARMHVRV